MDIKKMAVDMLMSKLGSGANSNDADSALSELIGGGDKFDISDMVGQLKGKGGGIAEKASSWLGDGANESVSASQVQEALGSDKIEAFASKLGVSTESASSSLSELLPQLVDKSSSNGNLLEKFGGAGGLAGMASKFLK